MSTVLFHDNVGLNLPSLQGIVIKWLLEAKNFFPFQFVVCAQWFVAVNQNSILDGPLNTGLGYS